MTSEPTLTLARQLLARGLSVIPIPPPIPGTPPHTPGDGKTAALSWKRYQTALPTEDDLAAWFSDAPMNLAVITGALAGVVVVDADSADAIQWCRQHLPATPWQTRTAKGLHLWYRHPGLAVRNKARLHTGRGTLAIDIRADGGYVIAPGSVHASGVIYRAVGDWSSPRSALPVFSRTWIGGAPSTRPPVGKRVHGFPSAGTLAGDRDRLERARRYLAAIPLPVIGQGSDLATFQAACRLVRGFNLSSSDAEQLLWEWAGGRPNWTREWVAAKVRHVAERSDGEPIGGLL